MNYSLLSCTFGAILVQTISPQQVTAKKEKLPNFIIINCDDLGFGDLSCFGHPTIRTPHLDKMAIEGQKWTSFYVSASVSSPSRAGLLTGRLGVRTGMYGNKRRVLFPQSPKGLPQEEKTIAELLKQKNYVTACVGKWHVGHHPNNMPLQNGFDFFYGFPFSNDMSKKEQAKLGNPNYPYKLPFYNQEKIFEYDPDQTQSTKRLTSYSLDFIKKYRRKQFFLYLAHPMPHVPVYASKDFQGKSARGKYGDTVEELDWSVGQIISQLKKYNLDKKTLVVFTSDNGPWLSYKELGGSAGHLKDGKASPCYEGGFRVPCIFWGNKITAGIITDMGSTLDFIPTFCDYANIQLPQDRVYDGVSLRRVLEKKEKSPRQDFYYYRGNEFYAIRKGAYKLVYKERAAYGSPKVTCFNPPHLYNMGEDPEERRNIAKKHPEKVKELQKAAEEFRSSFKTKKSIFDLRK